VRTKGSVALSGPTRVLTVAREGKGHCVSSAHNDVSDLEAEGLVRTRVE